MLPLAGLSSVIYSITVYKNLLESILKRLKNINIDAILETGYIEELICDNRYNPFPDSRITERPDLAAIKILEGYAVILVDGTPFVIVIPGRFADMLQTADDYYLNFYHVFFGQLVRWIALSVSLLLPAFYVALITFNQEMIPDELIFHIINDRETVAFPALGEALFMEISFEILREAGLRMPRNIGQAVSVVGVLVIGESAVHAGLVSPTIIIVVGLTSLAALAIPYFNMANTIRLLRFPIMILAGIFGFAGLMFGFFSVLHLLLAKKSFGIPYLSPFVDFTKRDFQSAVWRLPWWSVTFRPSTTANKYNQK